MSHSQQYLMEVRGITWDIDHEAIERMAVALSNIKGRIYMVGLGGSLANCIHMAADLRKLCRLDAVAPDNIAELTAWANDESWGMAFAGYFSMMQPKRDAIFVLSVGGGTEEVSTPITIICRSASEMKMPIFGIVGPVGGETAKLGDHVIKIPVQNPKHITPHTEAFQAVIWHCLVSHPLLQRSKTKW